MHRNEGNSLTGIFISKTLLAAKALANRQSWSPSKIIQIRHWANEGKSLTEIASLLDWKMRLETLDRRLKKLSIRPHSGVGKGQRGKKLHRGYDATYSGGMDDTEKRGTTGKAGLFKRYRPKKINGET